MHKLRAFLYRKIAPCKPDCVHPSAHPRSSLQQNNLKSSRR